MAPKNISDRLPPLTAALAAVSLNLEVQRDDQGQEWCAAHGIGAMRRKAGHAEDELTAEPFTPEIIRDEVRVFLHEVCRKCPYDACPMKAW